MRGLKSPLCPATRQKAEQADNEQLMLNTNERQKLGQTTVQSVQRDRQAHSGGAGPQGVDPQADPSQGTSSGGTTRSDKWLEAQCEQL